MSQADTGQVQVLTEYDIVTARQGVRAAAEAVGFGVTDTTRIVTATSELTRNIHLYAGSGTVSWHTLDGNRPGLELTFTDQGPGIEDVAAAMRSGFTTSKGLGMGLPGAKRLMDEMDLETKVGVGTTVVIRKWLPEA